MNKFCFVIILIAVSEPANSQFSLELNAGNERLAAYVKSFHYFDKSNRWSFYSSNRVALNYDTDQPGFFSANILAYNTRSGIGVGAMLSADNNSLCSSAGLQYQKTIGSCYLYFLSTYELNKLTRQENFFFLLYKHTLSQKVKFIFQYENYICFLEWGYDQSFQRIKPGIEIGQMQVGLISETSQSVKNHKTMQVNLGCFVKHSF